MAISESRVDRRRFLEVSAMAPLTRLGMGRASAETLAEPTVANAAPSTISIAMVVNRRRYELTLDSRMTLLDALREKLGLVGAKKGCDHGQCGACTVHVGGKRILSCLTLAAGASPWPPSPTRRGLLPAPRRTP
jgi:xanthine dehydrogenase YagT iron-sulfur-binding subunit